MEPFVEGAAHVARAAQVGFGAEEDGWSPHYYAYLGVALSILLSCIGAGMYVCSCI